MSIKLKNLVMRLLSERAASPAPVVPTTAPIAAPAQPGQEINVAADFTNFERTIASYTENAKNTFQAKLLSLTGNKQIFIRGSKGYGQPIKDYTINVKNVSIDFYYDRYVIVFKDDNDKEYFLEPGYKVKVLGPAVATQKRANNKKKKPAVLGAPNDKTQAPIEKPSQYNPIARPQPPVQQPPAQPKR